MFQSSSSPASAREDHSGSRRLAFSNSELARAWGVSRQSIYNAQDRGELPFFVFRSLRRVSAKTIHEIESGRRFGPEDFGKPPGHRFSAADYIEGGEKCAGR